MRIAIISDWFSEKMGYAENCLPKALAALGPDVHVISANVQPYFASPSYKATYEPFIGPPIVACEEKRVDGFTLHRLPHSIRLGRLHIDGLANRLRRLRPDIVQTFEIAALSTYEAALLRPVLRYRLFLESHLHTSAFGGVPPWMSPLVFGLGRLASLQSLRCYAISSDVATLGVERLGVERRKMEICSLGVDTQLFRPPTAEERSAARARHGFADDEIVCVYSGRFSEDKGPRLLAEAIAQLQSQGKRFRGLFIGSGTSDEIRAITSSAGCVHHPFVAVRDLPQLYWAGDLGVWPKQESTSQLDAASVGMPLILSDRVHVAERIDGNGTTYREGDSSDLARVIASLEMASTRRQMAETGIARMRAEFSWLKIAGERLEQFQNLR